MTLDNDLFGKRAEDNQVKTPCNRQTDTEGHYVDEILYSIFRVVLNPRFQRRGEGVVKGTKNKFWAEFSMGVGKFTLIRH